MADGNGQLGIQQQQQLERLAVAASALVDRLHFGARLGEMYGGARNVYDALGWKKDLTWDDFYEKYSRQDIAGRIVDLPADSTWREGFELADNDDPDQETPFEKAWKDLDKRLRLTSWLHRLDRIAGIGEYAVLYLGMRGQDNPEAPLTKGRPGDLVHATVFRQPNARLGAIDGDAQSERFGLPESYVLTVAERTGISDAARRIIGRSDASGSGRPIKVHWSRIIHAAESLEETKIHGRPRLQRVYNLLDVLQLVVGSSGEAFWRGARPRFHGNIDPEFSGRLTTDELAALGDEFAKFIHGLQDFMRTSGTQITQFGASVGDPRAPAEVVLELASAATGIPKRILMGSERGELASSQDAQEWAHRTAERQRTYAEPVLVRPLVDRLVLAGIMPEPTDGDYEVSWPDITGPTAEQRAMLAERITKAEATHAQAEMLGVPFVTRDELRETVGFPSIPAIAEDFPGQRAEEEKAEREEQERQAAEQDLELRREEAEAQRRQPANDDEERPEAASAPYVHRLPMVTRAVGQIQAATLREQLRDPILASIMDTANVAARGFGQEGADVATLAVRDFLADFDRERLEIINATTQQRVIETLIDGMQKRESVRQLRTRVRKVFARMISHRAPGIALTETTRSASFGTLQGFLAAGVATKTWTTMKDNRVREAHSLMEGQTVAVNGLFEAPGGELAPGPGLFKSPELSIGCRCFVTTLETPTNPEELAGLERRRSVHQRRVLAAVRRAFREQQAAVLNELEE